MTKISCGIILLALILISCGQKTNQARTRVVDNVNLLTAEQKARLTEQIFELETSVGSQIVILIIGSLNGEQLEEYSLRTANSLGLGREGYGDGILVTAAMNDGQMRIEVGWGLERILPD